MCIGMTVFISIDMLRVWNCFNECSSAISLSQNELNMPNMSNCNIYQQSPLHKILQDLPGSWCCFVMLCPEMRSAPQNGNWWTKWTIGSLGGTADRWHGDQVAMDSEGIICVLCADPLREVFKAAARSSVNPPSWAANSEMISTKVIKTVGGTTPVWYVLMLQKIWHKDGEKIRNMKKHKNKQFMSKQGLWMALGPWWTYIYMWKYVEAPMALSQGALGITTFAADSSNTKSAWSLKAAAGRVLLTHWIQCLAFPANFLHPLSCHSTSWVRRKSAEKWPII